MRHSCEKNSGELDVELRSYTPEKLSKTNMTLEKQPSEDVYLSPIQNGDFPLTC